MFWENLHYGIIAELCDVTPAAVQKRLSTEVNLLSQEKSVKYSLTRDGILSAKKQEMDH